MITPAVPGTHSITARRKRLGRHCSSSPAVMKIRLKVFRSSAASAPCGRRAEQIHQIDGQQRDHQNGQQRTVFQPFAGFRPGFQLQLERLPFEAVGLGGSRLLGRWSRQVGNRYAGHNQHGRHQQTGPEEDRVGERNQAADAEEFGRERALGGHQHRCGGRKPQRPHRCSAHIRGGAGCAVVQALDALRELTDEQPAQDGTHAPGNERCQLGEDSDQNDGLPRSFWEHWPAFAWLAGPREWMRPHSRR